MQVAFLFLTYDNFTNQNIMKKFLINQNIYIHPKYPNNVNLYFKKYIIENLIETKWSEYSIVQATINLLKKAFENTNNKWFVLLSEDCYPLMNINKFKNHLNKFDKSLFFFKEKNKYWKTSQWWILIRDDVETILNNHINIIIDMKGAVDEYYFLSLLKKNNSNYKFINYPVMYDKWLNDTTQKNPQYFNHLLIDDIRYIKLHNCFFIRKITNLFTLNKYKTKKKLYVLYIGTETNQNNIIFNNNFDIILIISININLIKKEIINSSIYIINIIYKFYYDTILSICNQDYIKKWQIVIFTTEKFNLNNYNQIDKQPKLLNNKSDIKFYYITDNNNNLAFCYKK